MLHSIRVENFFSIREMQTLDLRVAKNAPDHDHRFACAHETNAPRIPRVIAIFGANASGKTNLIKALSFVRAFARNSVDDKPDDNFPFLNFNAAAWVDEPTKIEVDFDASLPSFGDQRKNYSYSLELSYSDTRVINETLLHYPRGRAKRLFSRNKDNIYFSKEFDISKSDPITKRIRKNASIISTLAKFNHPLGLELYKMLEQVVSDVGPSGKFSFSDDGATDYYARSEDALQSLNDVIKKFDLGIEKVFIEESESGKEPRFIHSGMDYDLGYVFESQGTQSFYKLFPYINFVLNTGGIAALDELGSDIHPLLLPEIIDMFHDSEINKYDAQLIMTCHNASLLEFLEKDEIFFTEKRADGATEVYGLKSITGVRRDMNVYAKYLAGAFGAVPHVG